MTKIQNRKGNLVDEQYETVSKVINGETITYNQCYYLDQELDVNTGIVGSKLVRHYKKQQVKRNLEALTQAREGVIQEDYSGQKNFTKEWNSDKDKCWDNIDDFDEV